MLFISNYRSAKFFNSFIKRKCRKLIKPYKQRQNGIGNGKYYKKITLKNVIKGKQLTSQHDNKQFSHKNLSNKETEKKYFLQIEALYVKSKIKWNLQYWRE